MIFLYIISIYSEDLIFDCNTQEIANKSYYRNVFVSCPKDSQIMINHTTSKFYHISITDESNIIILCSKGDSPFNITVDSEATIYLDRFCNISNLKVYDNPKIFGNYIKVDVLFLYDIYSSDQLKDLDANVKIILYKNEDGIYEPQIGEYQCPTFFNFKFYDDTVNIECIKRQYLMSTMYLTIYYDFNISYDIISHYRFYVEKNLYFYNKNAKLSMLKNKFTYISKSLIMDKNSEFTYIDFLNPDDVEIMHSKINRKVNTSFLVKWSSHNQCNYFYNFESQNDELHDYINNAKNTRWRKICLDNIPHLILHENRDVKVVYITTAVLAIIIVLSLLIIVLMIITFYYLAKCKYQRDKNKISHNE